MMLFNSLVLFNTSMVGVTILQALRMKIHSQAQLDSHKAWL